MSNTPNTDTLEDQAREYYAKNSPFAEVRCIKLMADFARQVAKEAVRRREAEIMQKLMEICEDLMEICEGDVLIRTDLGILLAEMKAGSE